MGIEEFGSFPSLLFPPHEVYRFHLRAAEDLELPAYAGSAFRGLFGHALRRVVCALRDERCSTCLVQGSCTYFRVFETAVPPDKGPKPGVDHAPHPYVLVPPLEGGRTHRCGEPMACELLLMGPARNTLPYLVHTFQKMGRMGLTRERRRFDLQRVDALTARGWEPVFLAEEGRLRAAGVEAPPPSFWKVNGRLGLRFVTPLRVKSKGRLMRQFELGAFLAAVARRWADLFRYYGGGLDDKHHEQVRGLLDLAGRVRVARSEVRWQDHARYSNRQRTRMRLGGLTGWVVLEGAVQELAWWLAWAERFHVGKATSFGLGRIRVLWPEPRKEG